jgi:hypothetical protein
MSTFGDFTVTRASTKNVLGSNGLYGSVANNVPALEFNTDGSYRGLLVEPGATNQILQSQDFGTTWTNTGTTESVNSAVAPDGASTADKIDEDTSTGTHSIQQLGIAGATGDGTYTFSCFVKAVERTFVRFELVGNAAGVSGSRAVFNLTTGAVSSTTNIGSPAGSGSARITALPNGWYRCELTSTPGTTGNVSRNASISIGTDASTFSYTGVLGSGVLLWQAQLETGAVATSPIVTTGSTASRVADSVTLTGASSLIGQSAGTLYVETELPSYNIGANSSCLLAVNVDGASDIFANGIFIGCVASAVNQPRFRVSASGSNTADIQMSANRPAGIYKFAGAYASNDAAFYANGSSVGTDATVTVGANAEVYIGYSPVTSRQQVCWLRSVALFPTRLANATLASITTL